jgi:hypothetical protein
MPNFGWSVFFSCLLTGCGIAGVCPQPHVNDPQAAKTWSRLAEATIGGVYDHPVRLAEGQFSGAPFVTGGQSRPMLRLWPELFAIGNLDGDPGDEIVGLLSETSGGSGERVYLLAGKLSGDTLEVLPAKLVGDRVKVRALQIEDRKIILDIVEAGKQEPLCCGTTLTREIWTLHPDGLRLADKISQGRLSLRIIEDRTWQLVDNGATDAPADADCTTLAVSAGQITGSDRGKRYTGRIVEAAPGQIAISDLTGLTERGHDAPDARAKAYLELLASVTQYTFLAGRLTLVLFRAGRPVTLKFAPAVVRTP